MIQYAIGILPKLLHGLIVTLEVTAAGGALAFLMACAGGAARISKKRVLRIVAGIYIEVFRGTSAFVQIYWVYFVLPLFGVRVAALQAGIIILGLNVGSYGAEVIRGAINAVDKGQRDACVALNLPAFKAARLVIFPQAFVFAIPPLGNLLIDLLKGTSLLSAISLVELTFAAKQQIFANGHALEGYALVMLLYLAIGVPIVILFRMWENHSKRHLRRAPSQGWRSVARNAAKATVTS